MTLINPTFKKGGKDPILEILTRCTAGSSRSPKIADTGMVVMSHWNPELELNEVSNDFDKMYPEFEEFGSYGVVDSVEQFVEKFGKTLEEDRRNLFVTFVEIVREEQSPDGGWRYHKWGKYHGNQNPQHEYLYHDTHIDRVFTFSIYEAA